MIFKCNSSKIAQYQIQASSRAPGDRTERLVRLSLRGNRLKDGIHPGRYVRNGLVEHAQDRTRPSVHCLLAVSRDENSNY